jgi:CRISPR-associated endonuclease/helicase Cas3
MARSKQSSSAETDFEVSDRADTVPRVVVRRWKRVEVVFAHSVNEWGARHPLRDHLRSTAELARAFAAPFGAADLAYALGLLHDTGKATCAWQDGLLRAEARDGPVGIRHKGAGARLLRRIAGPAALAVLGHHGGLERPHELTKPAEPEEGDDGETLRRLLTVVPEVAAVLGGPVLLPDSWRPAANRAVLEMGVRMVFSALVDADHLDTAAHFHGLAAPQVERPTDFGDLFERFRTARAEELAGRAWSPIDGVRAEVYEAALGAADGPTGVYRLPAPTGAGKTMTAAAFALRHASVHGKSRIVVAVPFITITEQNAEVYRRLLGADVVLEHHSNVEFDAQTCEEKGRGGARLGAENWDSPFVVTTTVQLFDSLFGRKPSRMRKLHRLANAVFVLDEVQALPTAMLLPILDALRLLSEHFGTTVLLTSATQPAFQSLSVWSSLPVQDVVAQPQRVFELLRTRVRYEWRLDPRPSMAEVADEVVTHRQALVVVNRVADARRMYELLSAHGPALHLSTRMCPAHRRAVLARVRELLAAGEPVRLVSTQLIEAGVDVDFPVVFRAWAPADSLQQAAGRANREGRLPEPGLVVVFDPADGGAPPGYKVPAAAARLHFGPGRVDPDNTEALDRYYRELYHKLNLEHADPGRTIQANRVQLDFEAVADGPLKDGGLGRQRDPDKAFHMLDDDSVPVAVDHDPAVAGLLDRLRAEEGSRRDTFRALRPFVVNLPRWVVTEPAVQAMTEPIIGGLRHWRGAYHPALGIDEGAIGKESVW